MIPIVKEKNTTVVLSNLKQNAIHKKILESGSCFRFIRRWIESFPGMIIVVDTHDNPIILFVNGAMAQSLGSTPEKLVGTPMLDLFPKKIRENRKDYFNNVVKYKRTITVVDHREGRIFSNLGFPVCDDSGNVLYGVAIAREITAENELEKRHLINQEFFYVSLIEHALDLIVLVDATGRITYCSPSIKTLLGYNPKNVPGNSIFEVIHPDDVGQFKQIFHDIIANPSYFGKELFRVLHKNGEYRWFEGIYQNKLQDPQIKGIIINSRDITEQQDYRNQILEQKKYLETVMNNTAQIIFTLGVQDYKIKMWNFSAEINSGIKSKEIEGKSIRTVNLFENIAELQTYVKDVTNGKTGHLSSLILRLPHHGVRLWDVSPSLIKKDGQIIDIIFVCSDRTYRDETHGTLIPGQSYLITDTTREDELSIFKSLMGEDWAGYYITRTGDNLQNIFNTHMPKISNISFDKHTPDAISTLDDLYEHIIQFVKTHNKAVIVLDRLDYLMSLFSFREVMHALYRINDAIHTHQALFFLRINKLLFTTEQYAFFKEEFHLLPSKEITHIQLTDDEYTILSYILEQNTINNLVTQTHVCKQKQISKVTAQKRLTALVTKGLIITKKEGRIKTIHITDKGKELLQSHTIT